MVDAVSRGVPRVHFTTPGLGPSEAFRACLSPGIALEWLWGASVVLGRPGDQFFKKELFGLKPALSWKNCLPRNCEDVLDKMTMLIAEGEMYHALHS